MTITIKLFSIKKKELMTLLDSLKAESNLSVLVLRVVMRKCRDFLNFRLPDFNQFMFISG
jgi:hypothetical protein